MKSLIEIIEEGQKRSSVKMNIQQIIPTLYAHLTLLRMLTYINSTQYRTHWSSEVAGYFKNIYDVLQKSKFDNDKIVDETFSLDVSFIKKACKKKFLEELQLSKAKDKFDEAFEYVYDTIDTIKQILLKTNSTQNFRQVVQDFIDSDITDL